MFKIHNVSIKKFGTRDNLMIMFYVCLLNKWFFKINNNVIWIIGETIKLFENSFKASRLN